MAFTSQITILRARPSTVFDEFSTSTTLDWSDPEKVPVEFRVSVQPLSSSEGPVERPQVVTTWQLITPPGRDLPLRSTDRIRLMSGMEFAVVGDVQRWPHPIKPGAVHHVEAMLEMVSG